MRYAIRDPQGTIVSLHREPVPGAEPMPVQNPEVQALDRKSTRLNSSHSQISYSFFFFSRIRRPPSSPLFPSPTLFRSGTIVSLPREPVPGAEPMPVQNPEVQA